jgi:hypothetical protein
MYGLHEQNKWRSNVRHVEHSLLLVGCINTSTRKHVSNGGIAMLDRSYAVGFLAGVLTREWEISGRSATSVASNVVLYIEDLGAGPLSSYDLRRTVFNTLDLDGTVDPKVTLWLADEWHYQRAWFEPLVKQLQRGAA